VSSEVDKLEARVRQLEKGGVAAASTGPLLSPAVERLQPDVFDIGLAALALAVA
jgi:hypothetical protein